MSKEEDATVNPHIEDGVQQRNSFIATYKPELSRRAGQGYRRVTSALDNRYLKIMGLRIRHTIARRSKQINQLTVIFEEADKQK